MCSPHDVIVVGIVKNPQAALEELTAIQEGLDARGNDEKEVWRSAHS